ncbi:MAG: superoxide dismutase family protein [Clostridia bacterium]|nr:superoxide dismutase family protein [Clostridia bacterium]
MKNNIPNFASLFRQAPKAVARVKGSDEYPEIGGNVWFYQFNYGVLVVADIMGLPTSNFFCKNPIYAFHIHEGDSCMGNEEDPFADAKMHYNPENCSHPYHAGDLPPLFSANGFAFLAVLVNRFTIDEVIGRTVIIHSSVDDFVTQPSGNAGTKIACGKIVAFS